MYNILHVDYLYINKCRYLLVTTGTEEEYYR